MSSVFLDALVLFKPCLRLIQWLINVFRFCHLLSQTKSWPRQPFDHDMQWTYIAILVVFVIQSPFSVLPSDSIRIGSWWGIAQESHKSRFRTELPPRSINQDGIEMHLIHILISQFLIFQPVQHIREMKVKVTFDFSDAIL